MLTVSAVAENRRFIGGVLRRGGCALGSYRLQGQLYRFRLSELVVLEPSFSICVKPGHGYTTV